MLAGLALLFIIQNLTAINVSFIFWTLSISHSLLMLILFLAGLILGWFMHSFSLQSRKNVTK
jgi:uncharacterized integral membrane protein